MKPVKLSLSSTNEELLSTMMQEGKSVEYWHKKHYGGPVKYDKWQDEQLAKVQKLPAGEELIGEMVDYHSLTTGNRWKSFEVTSCYGKGNAFTRMFRFCYWDTYGSVGAFYKCTNDKGKNNLLVFPSHFFLRYADRMGIKHRDAALVCEFFNQNHTFAIEMSVDPDENGRRQFIIAAKEGVCYGFARTPIETHEDFCERDNVYEVRTFLRYEQLNSRQRKECQPVRELADMARLTDGAPDIHAAGRILTDENFAEDAMVSTAKILGLSTKQMEDYSMIHYAVLKSADFVSGELRGFIDSLAKGKIGDKLKAENQRLLEIVARRVRETNLTVKTFGYYELFDVTHEWKGDNYDWNKWFWSLCNKLKENANTEDKAKFDGIMQKCIDGEFTYQSLEAYMMLIKERQKNG